MVPITYNDRIHVLIVSNDPGMRRMMDQGLAELGYETYTASDGEAALATFKHRRIDVVVTTADLPGMNGIQLSRTVSRIHPDVPAIIMCQRPEPGQVAQALSSGAADLVSEHVSPEEMESIIQRNLDRKAAAALRVASDRAEVLFKAIRAVTAAIDAKSHYAAKHSTSITHLSLMIGRRLGLSREKLLTLELAAQLHDIGKIGTPDSVLTKPDTLSDEEWVDVLKHPALGSAFLAPVPELAEVAAIVRHHHEHYAGTGYPDGLQAEAIPLLSRIIAVADAYDAMTSERPYRRAMTYEQAFEELRRHSGTQFDRSIVDHLIAGIRESSVERKAA
ncbi:MAG: HD domain-containing protein [Armatimonadetes bacterium]|nr:HD domain-containing protein [Armatimonadota bacterium]